ncbi:hypothetical protein GALMADRAFT_219236 [Galerina marginata CBS 339.88]|uniref:Cyclin N-terminal domain-containing protein n=1 Tax=Galerina marginata (strain CBS 339.88) TaxID=685588 RepID=A0A067TJU2_GALM3|nr:hypothetical protein GALMADRAFT_219236 [Galerina marginata CBS 339.88]
MPVPVPRQSKPLAHPVIKATHCAQGQGQNVTGSLPVPPLGPPPSFGTREEWLSSLPSWRRNKQRLGADEDGLPAQLHHTQDFYLGLAAAGNATVIKGAHAEACIPPTHDLFHHHRGVSDLVTARDQFGGMSGVDVEISRGSRFPGLTAAHLEGAANTYAPYDGIDAMLEDMPHGFNGKLSPIRDLTNSATLNNRCYHSGAFSPIFEDQSPGSASGPDSGSSPLEPLTPFGEFVDRAVADAQYASLDGHYVDRGVIRDYYKENDIPDVYQAAPVFPSIADQPKQQDLISDTVTPSSSVGYKTLAEPLSEWVANYVWNVCTTGFSLPSAFAQPSTNAGPYAVTAPSYLAPSVHSLLLSTLLQPSAVLLAVWYIVRLPVYFAAAPLNAEFVKENAFRLALLGCDAGLDHDAAEASATFRLVVLGCMLANKWLDDHTFSNKTWHSISNVPVQTLNKLESLALDIFTYDLSVSSPQWSQWLSHVLSYHLSLSSPTFPQPISRPSSNPHSIVRRAIEEIIQAPSTCKSMTSIPRPVFLGLEDRLRERQEKEQALAMDVLEIDLDEDGPLREEYLPKRRASKLGSQVHHDNGLVQTNEKWNLSEGHPIKTLPPPAKWSPAGDEPILRDRNRVSGHYVAVQAPPMATGYPANRDVAYNQNWNPAAYVPMKSQTGYMYDMPPVFGVGHPNYNPFGYIASVPLPHSRSQSLSYDQDTLMSHNHMRSYSQTRFEYKSSDLRMTACEHPQIHESESRWMDAAGHYPYPGPAYIHIPAVGMQPSW